MIVTLIYKNVQIYKVKYGREISTDLRENTFTASEQL